MANILPKDKQITVIANLCEGSSIRAIERMTGIHRDTIMRLGVRVGETCAKIMDEEMRDLNCNRLELDELWNFVGKKKRNVKFWDREIGDAWTYVALDAETKLVPAYLIGSRNSETTNLFLKDLASRLNNRVQISTDGMSAYMNAVDLAFGKDVDYGQIVKTFSSTPNKTPSSRYSPGTVTSISKEVIQGNPDEKLISTSYVESQNLTIRMHNRRATRLTNAYSKKMDNFKASMGLYFAYYNFVMRHSTIRCTPAMAAGVTSSFWTVGDLVDMAQ